MEFNLEKEVPLWVEFMCKSKDERDKLYKLLLDNQIQSRIPWEPFLKLPNSRKYFEQVLWLPNGPSFTKEQQEIVINKIKEFYDKGFEKVHSDDRRTIYANSTLLNGKEISIIHLKKGKAIGGCMHEHDENYAVLSGKVDILCGQDTYLDVEKDMGVFPAFSRHAFLAKEDSIIMEWGITPEEKNNSKKDEALLNLIKKVNEGK